MLDSVPQGGNIMHGESFLYGIVATLAVEFIALIIIAWGYKK